MVEPRRVTSLPAVRSQLAICTGKGHAQIHRLVVKQRNAELTVDRAAQLISDNFVAAIKTSVELRNRIQSRPYD